jgi:hypothetical protein
MECVISLENVKCVIRLSRVGAFSLIVIFCSSQYMPLAIRSCQISLRIWQLSSRNSAVTPLPDVLKFQISLLVLRFFSRTCSIHHSFRWISAANHTRHGNVFRKFNRAIPRRRSAAARLLRLWVRIPPGAWMIACCECCVLSGRGLCDGLITRPEESYRLWGAVVCDLQTSRVRRPGPALGRSATKKRAIPLYSRFFWRWILITE